jgi:hypothetical protein
MPVSSRLIKRDEFAPVEKKRESVGACAMHVERRARHTTCHALKAMEDAADGEGQIR